MAPEVILAMDEGQYDGKVCHVYLLTKIVTWNEKKNQAYIYGGNKNFTSNKLFHTVIIPSVLIYIHT